MSILTVVWFLPAHIDLPECREAIATGRLKPDNKILMESGQSICSKAAIEPVWYLPEIARRFETTESHLRQSIFRMTSTSQPSDRFTCVNFKLTHLLNRRNVPGAHY